MNARILGAASAGLLLALSSAAQAVAVPGQGTWETTLQPRDFDGDPTTAEAYYDTVLDITWWAGGVYYPPRRWPGNTPPLPDDFGGVWGPPRTLPLNGSDFIGGGAYDGSADLGYNVSAPGTPYAGSTASQMAHLFYNTLGNLSLCAPTSDEYEGCTVQEGGGLTNTGPFTSFLSQGYPAFWSEDTAFGAPLYFDFRTGEQKLGNYDISARDWPVASGDRGAAVVPIPAGAWLLGSGLLGLLGLRCPRHRRRSPFFLSVVR